MNKYALRILLSLVAISGVLPICSFGGQTKEKVVWLTIDYPPYYCEKQKNGEKGIYNQVMEYAGTALKDTYRFEVMEVSMNRAIQLLEKPNASVTYCKVGGGSRAEKEKLLALDSVLFRSPSAVLVVRRSSRWFAENRAYSLVEFDKMKGIRLGYHEGVEYGRDFKKWEKAKASWLFPISVSNPISAMKMLAAKRLDGFFLFPYVVSHSEEGGAIAKELRFVTVNEMRDEWSSRVFCSKTEVGKKLMTDLGEVLNTHQFKSFALELLKLYESAPKPDRKKQAKGVEGTQ